MLTKLFGVKLDELGAEDQNGVKEKNIGRQHKPIFFNVSVFSQFLQWMGNRSASPADDETVEFNLHASLTHTVWKVISQWYLEYGANGQQKTKYGHEEFDVKAWIFTVIGNQISIFEQILINESLILLCAPSSPYHLVLQQVQVIRKSRPFAWRCGGE